MLQFSMSCDDDELRPLPSPSQRESLEREVERGNVEYKLKMIDPSDVRLQQLVTQLKWRLAEGAGEALYEIGVADDGTLAGLDEEDMAASLDTLRRMSVWANAKMSVLHRRAVCGGMTVCEVLMQTLASSEKTELRVACIGGTQAGKSTLVAVLSAGTLDNGHGSARTSVMRHPHELESGSTSCISQQVLGFDAQGVLLNSDELYAPTGSEIVEQAVKLTIILDLCGQERFLKTTLYGLTAHAPDYALLVIAADAPIGHMTRLHLRLALALRLRVAAVLTRADLCDAAALDAAAAAVLCLLAEAGAPAPALIDTEAHLALLDPPSPTSAASSAATATAAATPPAAPSAAAAAAAAPSAAATAAAGGCTPLFVISATSGRGLPLLKAGMWRMRSRSWAAARTEPALVTVDGCHPPSSELVLQEDDPWSTTPAQEVSITDGFVVSRTVSRGTCHGYRSYLLWLYLPCPGKWHRAARQCHRRAAARRARRRGKQRRD